MSQANKVNFSIAKIENIPLKMNRMIPDKIQVNLIMNLFQNHSREPNFFILKLSFILSRKFLYIKGFSKFNLLETNNIIGKKKYYLHEDR